jgi:hypothetical protein
MKNLFIFILSMLFSLSLYAQDLIVTHEDDSLNCKITGIKKNNIYFTFLYKEEIRNTLMPVNQVKKYQYNYYQTPEIIINKVIKDKVFPRFRVAVDGGWGYRTGRLSNNIPADFRAYANKLKSGFHYALDVSYFFTEHMGVGLKYDALLSRNKMNGVFYVDNPSRHGVMSDNIAIRFIGPIFYTRLLNRSKKNCLLAHCGIGYLAYRDNVVLLSDDYILKGNTVGVSVGVGYDIGITKNFALGFQLSLLTGTVTKYTISGKTSGRTTQPEEGENLSHINLSIGLRFNK